MFVILAVKNKLVHFVIRHSSDFFFLNTHSFFIAVCYTCSFNAQNISKV